MDRVGGYASYAILMSADASDFEDIVIVLAGEAEAARIRELKKAGAAQRAAAQTTRPRPRRR